MNAKAFGKNLAALRKKKGYTQAGLAEKLNLSDKTVSKWENGLGYPDITMLPSLARLLGVTVDGLLKENKSGVIIAGNLIVDIVNNIAEYPKMGMLTNVFSSERAVGGCAANTSVDLATIDAGLSVKALGKVGEDEYGRFLINKLQSHGVDTSEICVSDKVKTSFCNVMSVPQGDRAFFSFNGANAEFSAADVDVSALDCKIFHIGYILLLAKFDEKDEEYGTALARFLHALQERGIKTSIDVVSSNRLEDYAEKVVPALKYADYAIVNEIECCATFGIEPRNADGSLNVANVRLAMEKAMQAGVKEKVIVHAKEAGFCLDKDGTFTKVGSLKIPAELIKGSVGAGDAFCAGCLYGIYNELPDEEMLKFASAAAACNLFSENSVDGMRNKKEIKKLAERFDRREI